MRNDFLNEIVTLLRPTATLSKTVEFAGSWRICRDGTGEPVYCAVLEGTCRLRAEDDVPVVLNAGDFVMLPALRRLELESHDPPNASAVRLPVETAAGCYRVGPSDESADLRLQIGHCQFVSRNAAFLVPLLPNIIVARGASRLATFAELIAEETRAQLPARELVLERMLELLLIEAIRRISHDTPVSGIVRGLADARIAAALRAVHSRPDHLWTVEELARHAAMSRSAFFARFSRTIGLTPMSYLTSWRMALAQRLLSDHPPDVAQVARRVGYSSASTFSIAFLRHTGISPARYIRERGGHDHRV
ncbi:AraC family transcriptional regulator [Acuticoccus sediminis]|uniref:AraC family transcriptional regulator n=1 Tax=Acuticoccus sediminis TaxID=2184697 RepID=UPI001CFECAB4|nr:AraC family transcriptional regulator [Acuticoccus sediminis]